MVDDSIKKLQKELVNAQKQAKIKKLKEEIKKAKGDGKIKKFFMPQGNEDEVLERLMKMQILLKDKPRTL